MSTVRGGRHRRYRDSTASFSLITLQVTDPYEHTQSRLRHAVREAGAERRDDPQGQAEVGNHQDWHGARAHLGRLRRRAHDEAHAGQAAEAVVGPGGQGDHGRPGAQVSLHLQGRLRRRGVGGVRARLRPAALPRLGLPHPRAQRAQDPAGAAGLHAGRQGDALALCAELRGGVRHLRPPGQRAAQGGQAAAADQRQADAARHRNRRLEDL